MKHDYNVLLDILSVLLVFTHFFKCVIVKSPLLRVLNHFSSKVYQFLPEYVNYMFLID